MDNQPGHSLSPDASLLIQLEHVEEALVQALQAQGIKLIQRGCLEEALSAFEQALRRNPSFVPASVKKGLVLSELGRLEEAHAAFELALQLDPTNADALQYKSRMLTEIDLAEEGRTEQVI